MATTSNWSAWVQASTGSEAPSGTTTSFWSGWQTATTAAAPDPDVATEWWVARADWVPAVMVRLQ